MEERYCLECGTTYGIENHHIVSRKQCKPLENCNHDVVDLCFYHHRDHKQGVHFNKELNRKYKLQFQNYLEIHFLKEYLEREDIKQVLEITDRPLDRLLKSLTLYKGKYVRTEVIIKCMGGKLVEEDAKKDAGINKRQCSILQNV